MDYMRMSGGGGLRRPTEARNKLEKTVSKGDDSIFVGWMYVNLWIGTFAHIVVGTLLIAIGFAMTSNTVNKGFLILRPSVEIVLSNYTVGIWNAQDFVQWNYPWVSLSAIGFYLAALFYLVELVSAILSADSNGTWRSYYLDCFISNKQNIFQWLRISSIYIFLNINFLFAVGQGELGQMFLMVAACFMLGMCGWLQEVLTTHKNSYSKGAGQIRYTSMGFGLFVILWLFIFIIRSIYLGYEAQNNSVPWWVWTSFFLMMVYDLLGMFLPILLRTFNLTRMGSSYFLYSFVLNVLSYFTVIIIFIMTGPNYWSGY